LALGCPGAALRSVVSSGEVAWQAIRDGVLGAPFVRGARAFVVGKTGDDYDLDGLLKTVENPVDADFLLICASNAPTLDLAAYAELLGPAARQKRPALCSNPDKTMLHASGLQPGAGTIADLYASLGGPVVHIGKPYRAIYDAARAMVGPGQRTLVVGDSIEHDIRGGADAGLATALVRTGILADVAADDLEALFVRYGARPDYILPSFRWT
jgi:HAD superfamily hydrolase (TIGR01459 family)